jgi:tetratricopeptide (TPR) repeat protein
VAFSSHLLFLSRKITLTTIRFPDHGAMSLNDSPLEPPALTFSTSVVKMNVPRALGAVVLLLLGGLQGSAQQSKEQSTPPDGSILQRRYDAAQKFQAANDLEHAAQQYRIFIADALGEFALGHARAGQYDKAANDFDTALHLVSDFPAMKIQYARVSLDAGNPDHAILLASGVIRDYPNNQKVSADAHAILGRAFLKINQDAKAKQQFEAAVALDPTFENGYELAVADLDLGDGKGAAKIFSEMVASFGDSAVIHMYFGQAYGRSDFQDDAVAEFQKAIAKDDRLSGVHYSLAAAYLSTSGRSKLSEAQAELRKEIALSPDYAPAYAALGHLLAQEKDPASQLEAETNLKRATELDPASPDGFLYLGQFYSDAHKLPEAEAALRQSIALTTDVSRNAFQVQKAHYLLGRILMQTGDPDAGKKEIAISQSLLQQNLRRDQNQLSDYLQTKSDPKTTSALATEMPMTVDEHKVDPAAARQVEQLEKQLGPAIADSYNNLGAIAGSEGDYIAALQSFEHAAEWNPALPGLDINWGRAAYSANAFAQAIAPLSHYLQTHPTDNDARAQLGLSQFAVKDYAATRQTLEPLNGASAVAPRIQFAYAASLVRTGDAGNGVTKLQDLEKTNPNIGEVHRELGEAYAAQNSPKAAAELESAVRLDPSDADAHVALAHLQLAKGNKAGARAQLEAAVKLQPNNVALQEELASAGGPLRH